MCALCEDITMQITFLTIVSYTPTTLSTFRLEGMVMSRPKVCALSITRLFMIGVKNFNHLCTRHQMQIAAKLISSDLFSICTK